MISGLATAIARFGISVSSPFRITHINGMSVYQKIGYFGKATATLCCGQSRATIPSTREGRGAE
jgi:hypothetical protein